MDAGGSSWGAAGPRALAQPLGAQQKIFLRGGAELPADGSCAGSLAGICIDEMISPAIHSAFLSAGFPRSSVESGLHTGRIQLAAAPRSAQMSPSNAMNRCSIVTELFGKTFQITVLRVGVTELMAFEWSKR